LALDTGEIIRTIIRSLTLEERDTLIRGADLGFRAIDIFKTLRIKTAYAELTGETPGAI
jgi:hypothetical protein